MIDGVFLWDCVCDACDPRGRYHQIPQGKWSKPPKQDPNWLLILVAVAVGFLLMFCLRYGL